MPIIQKYVAVETGQVKDLAPTTERRRGRPKGSKNINGTKRGKQKGSTIAAHVGVEGSVSANPTTMIVQSTSTRGLILKHLPIRHQTGLIPCIGSCKGACTICGIIGWNRDEKGWPTPIYRKMGKLSAGTVAYPLETTNLEKPVQPHSTTQDGTTTKRTTVIPSNGTLSLSKLFGGTRE